VVDARVKLAGRQTRTVDWEFRVECKEFSLEWEPTRKPTKSSAYRPTIAGRIVSSTGLVMVCYIDNTPEIQGPERL